MLIHTQFIFVATRLTVARPWPSRLHEADDVKIRKSVVKTVKASGILESSIHREFAWFGLLVANLVDRLFLTPACKKLVRSVEDQSRHIPNVAIGVYDARWNPDRRRVGSTLISTTMHADPGAR